MKNDINNLEKCYKKEFLLLQKFSWLAKCVRKQKNIIFYIITTLFFIQLFTHKLLHINNIKSTS